MPIKQLLSSTLAFAITLTALSAQTNVANSQNGGSIEQIKGQANAKETATNMIDGNVKSRCVFYPPGDAAFRIRFFKEMDIDRVKILKATTDKFYSIKDVVIRTSTGKEILYTLPEEGYNSKDRKATPAYAVIPVNDTCDYIDVIITSAYPTGKEYTAVYEIQAETSEDLSGLLNVDYNEAQPRYIMRTKHEPGPQGDLEIDASTFINGQPVKLGPDVFPKTIFSPSDIAYYRAEIRTNKIAKKAYDELIEACDLYLKQDVKIPLPDASTAADTGVHTKYSEWIANLAFAYVLGDYQKPEYAKKSIELMKFYADNYSDYGPTKHPKFNHDTAKITWQRLSEAMWGISVVFAYDMLMSDPKTFPSSDATYIREKLLIPLGEELKRGSGTVTDPATNWSAYPALYMLMLGRITNDQDWINLGMYGSAGQPTASTTKTKGNRTTHMMPGLVNKIRDGIDDQGNWVEPSAGYARMAAAAMITGSRVAWNMGENWYALGNGNLRRLRESSLNRATAENTIPGTEDSKEQLIGEDYYTALNEHLGLTYKDNGVLQSLLAVRKGFTLKIRFQTILPSIDFNFYSAAESEPLESIYLPTLGYTIARQDYDNNPLYFMFDASIETSHGHPDKLQIILHAHDNMVLQDPGMIWYANPEYLSWYRRTGTHNTVSINETNMQNAPPALEIFASADKMHLVRGTAPKAYPGTILTRNTLQLDTILIDVFRVDTKINADIDYNLHFRGGELAESPKGVAGKYFTKNPLKQLSDQQKHTATDNIIFRWNYEDDRIVQYQSVAEETEVFSGQGIIPLDNPDDYVILRRNADTNFFSTIDACIGESRVKHLDVLPSDNTDLFQGKITYTDGHTGYVIVNYSNDITQATTTDGVSIQGYYAYVELDKNQDVIKVVYAGEGGTVKKDGVVDMQVSGPAVILLDQFSENTFTARNMNNRGEADVSLQLKMPLKDSYAIYHTDEDGQRTGKTTPLKKAGANGVWEIALSGANRQEITDSKVSVYEIEKAKREEAIRIRKEKEKAHMARRFTELETMYTKAANNTPSGEVLLLQAEEFTSETVGVSKKHAGRPGGYGSPGSDSEYLIGWVTEGHEINWDFHVKKSGYYAISIKYSSAEEGHRAITIDGKPPAPFFEELRFITTGGWSTDADNWEVVTLNDPTFDLPWLVYLDAGKHTISIKNVGQGMNIDYIVLHDFTLASERSVFEKQESEKAKLPDFAEIKNLYLN